MTLESNAYVEGRNFSYSSAHLTYPPLPSVPQFPFRLPCILKRAKHSFSDATAPIMENVEKNYKKTESFYGHCPNSINLHL